MSSRVFRRDVSIFISWSRSKGLELVFDEFIEIGPGVVPAHVVVDHNVLI